ncbi:DUF1178 family protein [soil metagenome]
MIRYDLHCQDGHEFDGWFRDSAAYDDQAAAKLVTCPLCGSDKIGKQLMTPGLPAKLNRKSEVKQPVFTGSDARQAQLLAMMRELRQHIEANAENVGSRFADEARKIHYEEVEKRGIFGEATAEDAKALVEEGIEIHPLPRLPEDGN